MQRFSVNFPTSRSSARSVFITVLDRGTISCLVACNRQPLSPLIREIDGETGDRGPITCVLLILAPFKRVVSVVTLVDWPFLNTKPPTMSRRILNRPVANVYTFSVFTMKERFVGDRP